MSNSGYSMRQSVSPCAGFKAAGSKAETTVRTIFLSRWSRDGDCIVYDVAGSGFLYNMVRIMVGTCLDIATGKRLKNKTLNARNQKRIKNFPYAILSKSVVI